MSTASLEMRDHSTQVPRGSPQAHHQSVLQRIEDGSQQRVFSFFLFEAPPLFTRTKQNKPSHSEKTNAPTSWTVDEEPTQPQGSQRRQPSPPTPTPQPPTSPNPNRPPHRTPPHPVSTHPSPAHQHTSHQRHRPRQQVINDYGPIVVRKQTHCAKYKNNKQTVQLK
jgi:hypothetical protein